MEAWGGVGGGVGRLGWGGNGPPRKGVDIVKVRLRLFLEVSCKPHVSAAL